MREALFLFSMPTVSTFKDVAERWLAESAGSVTAGTTGHYKWLLENYIYPRLGEKDVAEIAEEDVRELVADKRSQGLSAGSVYPVPKLIRRILSYGSAEGLCAAPEWVIVKGKPEKASPTVILSPEQERRLLAYLTDNPTPKHLGIYLILTTGIGVGELLALTWADVFLPDGADP